MRVCVCVNVRVAGVRADLHGEGGRLLHSVGRERYENVRVNGRSEHSSRWPHLSGREAVVETFAPQVSYITGGTDGTDLKHVHPGSEETAGLR